MVKHPRQAFMLSVITGTPILAALFVAFRIASRRWHKIKLSWDDYLIIVACVLSNSVTPPSWNIVKMWHFGRHVWEVKMSREKLEPNMDYYYRNQLAFNMLHGPVLPLVKASIMILLFRIGHIIDWMRRTLYVVFAFNAITCLIIMFTTLFACPPMAGNRYKDTVFGGLKCFGGKAGAVMYVFYTSANMFTDLVIFPIPFIMIYRLQHRSSASKILAIVAFALSFFATALGALRLKESYAQVLFHKNSKDWTWDIDWCINHAEGNVAIMAACMPMVHSLISKYFFGDKQQTVHTRSPTGSNPFTKSSKVSNSHLDSDTTTLSNTSRTLSYGERRTPPRHSDADSILSIDSRV